MGGDTLSRNAVSRFPRYSAGPVGQQIHSIYKGRLGIFQDGGQYEKQNLQALVLEYSISYPCDGYIQRPET